MYRIFKYQFLFLFLGILLLNQKGIAQDVEAKFNEINERATENPLTVSGSINSSLLTNYISGIDARFDPFSWRLSANLSLDFLSWKLPFSLNVADKNVTYNIPSYQFYGASPTYKWLTIHGGFRALNFSPYTLSGHSFLGAGVELKPGNFRLSAMYGRLQRATAEDLLSLGNINPVYKRMGWGFKIGYDNGKDNLYLIAFNASDEENSIPLVLDNPSPPKDNFIISLTGKKQLGEKLWVSGEYARSAITTDKFSPMLSEGNNKLFQSYAGLFDVKTSSGFHNALQFNVGYDFSQFFKLKLEYERIDPGYRTLGSLFFNDDIERYTISPNLVALQGKLLVYSRLGIQRNNLKKDKLNTTLRFVFNINTNYQLSERVNLNASYSNFRNTNKFKVNTNPLNPIDSLKLANVNQSASLGINYTIGQNNRSVIQSTLSFQNSNFIENDESIADLGNTFLMGSLLYSYRIKESKFGWTLGMLANYASTSFSKIVTTSPTIGMSKGFEKLKQQIRFNLSYGPTFSNGTIYSSVLRFNSKYQIEVFKQQRLGVTFGLINRNQNNQNAGNSFFEVLGGLNYNYTF